MAIFKVLVCQNFVSMAMLARVSIRCGPLSSGSPEINVLGTAHDLLRALAWHRMLRKMGISSSYSKYLGLHASCALDLDLLLLCMSRTWDGGRPGQEA